jgi:outer membrane protein OmpA-like peptidoglycan-associated protein
LGPEKPLVNNNEDNLLASIAQPVNETVIEKPVQIKENQVTILKGKVMDEISLNPLGAVIEITDNERNEVISSLESNSVTGKYLISLPSGKNYGIAVKAEGYLFHSENLNIPPTTTYREVEKDIKLKKLEVGSTIVLNNIFFDFDKSTLRTESYPELERLLKLLNDYPTLKIEISGHTDNKGSASYNKTLSENRAKAVVDYLTGKDINKSRLTYVGFGFDKPIATNDTDEGRQLNRRTEFKILSK